jgi:Ca2+-binding RTX toxin-like protein
MPIPTFFGPERVVNTGTAGFQAEADSAGLATGKYVVIWTDGTGASAPGDIKAQLFNADGSRFGGEFLVNQATVGHQNSAAVAALSDGRFVVMWQNDEPGADGSGSCIKGRIFNPDGTPATPEFLVNSTTTNNQSRPDVAALTGGGFVITWEHADGDEIRARVFNAQGATFSDDFAVDNGSAGSAPAIVGLSNGNFVIAWADPGDVLQTDGSGRHVRAQIFSGSDTPVGQSFIVNSTVANDQSDPALAALRNGTFVAGWTDESPDRDIRARVFANTGAPRGSDFLVDGESAAEANAAMTALLDNRYFIAWDDRGSRGETDGSGWHVRGEVFSGIRGNGGSSTDEFVANRTRSGHQLDASLSTLADGRVIAVWTDASRTGSDRDGTAVRMQLFDPRTAAVSLSGTGHGDDYVGTRFADVLAGHGGNDRLLGGAGNDRLLGGIGNDVLIGGAGNDRLDGGAGNDTVSGDAGDDQLLGGHGFDRLNGGIGIDTLNGGTGNDRLTGGLGRDALTGGDGSDVFAFNRLAESLRGPSHDTVTFVRSDGDKIDLSAIDADTDATPGNQAFRFIGAAAFAGVDGQLRFAGGLLQGDTNGDRVADIEVRIIGALTGADVIL